MTNRAGACIFERSSSDEGRKQVKRNETYSIGNLVAQARSNNHHHSIVVPSHQVCISIMSGTSTSAKSPMLAVALTGTVFLWLMKRRRAGPKNDGWFVSSSSYQDLFLSVNSSNKLTADKDDHEKCIYLDYNGTTPIYPEVLEAMMPYLTQHFGNPSSGHAYGDAPAAAVAMARKQILRELLGVTLHDDGDDTSAIVFTSCGTEADNLAIHWALQQQQPSSSSASVVVPHVVTSNVEHPAIEECLKAYVAEGRAQVTFVPVGTDGRVTYQDMVAAIQPNT